MTRSRLPTSVRTYSWRNLLAGSAIGLLAACSTVPGSGPRTGDIERGATPAAAPYALVDLDPDVARTISTFVATQRAEGPVILPQGRPPGLVGAGDLLRIAIWEPNPNGTSLTTDKSGIETTTRVGIDGTIGVPYVGRLHAAGRTPAQIEREIGVRLAHESPGAQVVVLVTEDLTNAVIVQGDVVKPGRYPVVPGSSGLLDILAMAGGPHTADRQTLVRITRGASTVTRTLSHLVDTRALEMDLAPGDRILVQPRLSFFYAFGAVNRPGEQAYDADDISLAHTLARIEGLSDNRADPAAVFIYRRQTADLTRQLGHAAQGQDATRVIYRLNLRDPGGFFVSQQFPVLPDDLIYVSDAPIAEAAKVFQIVTGLSSIGAIPRNMGASY
ncbi:MAG: polysaccharide biosynthesis/export family protein [Rhodopila sp.]|nr:polysaccharide biosynthesis/export family protein [Rhodopila sp.]